MEWNLAIVRASWVFDCFRDQKILDLSDGEYELKLFEGLVVCTTGLSDLSREQVVKICALHGAIYDPNLEIGHTNVLIAQKLTGEKCEAALAHGIPVLHLSWLHACLDKGGELLQNSSS